MKTLIGMTKEQDERWWNRLRAVSRAARSLREQALHRIEAHYELESDEFLTARQKAEHIYNHRSL